MFEGFRRPPAGAARAGVEAVSSGSYGPADRERWFAEDQQRKRADRDDFARDRGRLVHSAALRRLSATTQVVQPNSDDFVRNRLTHSLEVAQIGREFGAALGCNGDVVDTACLAHDLGHPPFGHHGESVLNEIADDIGGFEGNAQTLRILTRLEAKRSHADGRSAGLNLTRASLDAATKYPWARGQGPVRAKFGHYPDDADVFAWVRQGAPAGQPFRRCLEAQVMDWSDDVAYCVHDVEDAIASRRVDPAALRRPQEQERVVEVALEWYGGELGMAALTEALSGLIDSGWIPESFDGSRAALAALKDMTSLLIGRFVSSAEDHTRAAAGAGALVRYDADLVVPALSRAEVAVLKAIAAHYVMLSAERRDVMGEQREVVADLVGWFQRDEHRMDPIHRATRQQAHLSGDRDAARRAVIDQVASLSDARAWLLWREFSGNEQPTSRPHSGSSESSR